jgi:type IV pilus assembly protein PilY1
VHQLLLDGVPVVKDVVALKTGNTFVYERTLGTFREGTNSTWRTVLVQSFGGNRGGYFAVDVTDPEVKESGGGPTFLWQLTTDADGNPLFGESGGTPLITTLFYEENQVKKEVAVAVLPGGRESKTGTACNRNSTSNLQDPDFDLQVRTQVNCYGDDGGRSLTIVRLDTGEIILTFRRDDTEVPAGSLRARVNEAPLDSPITGEPVAFPGATGAVADKIFVGDIDGTLWRVNVASTNPAEWTMRLFFDGYSGKDFDDGQPIATPPILSTDDAGNVTIAFSTGDQEILTADAAMNNYVWSLTENLEGSSVEARVNWYWEFDQGERVAGPMTLFNGSLFFSSFTPVSDTTDKCASGSSTVWAMDYIEPNRTDDKSQGGEGRLPAELEDLSATWPQSIGAADLVEEGQPDDITVFGVTVAQLPTCVEEVNTTDGFFGSGTHTSFSTINPGKFQLVMQTGRGGSTIGGGDVKAVAFDLESPTASPRIDSWASIIE